MSEKRNFSLERIERTYMKVTFFGGTKNSEDLKVDRRKLLLHSCCGPCSTGVIERLVSEYDVTVFFYNPNIYPKEEYLRRLSAQKKFIESFNKTRKAGETEKGVLTFHQVVLLVGEYNQDEFFEAVKGLESEKEGGQRCVECYGLRLERTAQVAQLGGFDIFATTLTVSPYKDYGTITEIGLFLGEKYGIEYLATDFKKQNGYQRSIELSKEYGLYRQDYCGCIYSKEEREKTRK